MKFNRFKIHLYLVSMSLIHLLFNQIVIWIYSIPMDKINAPISVRLIHALQPCVLILFTAFSIILIAIMDRIFKPLLHYLLEGVNYEKARKVTIRINLINMILQPIFWGIGVFVFYSSGFQNLRIRHDF